MQKMDMQKMDTCKIIYMQKDRHVEKQACRKWACRKMGMQKTGHVEEWACRKLTCRNGHV